MTLLGIDLGSSSVKATLVDSGTGRALGSAQSPDAEMAIDAPRPGWAEQDPETWWTHTQRAVRRALDAGGVDGADVGAVGVAYQMHGLVLTGGTDAPLRPAIIWCDGRAAGLGAEAFREMGEARCLRDFLNSPGNFTASKLAWVKEHEPDVYAAARRAMLPGDWLVYRMTGAARTTASGLSEAVLWHMAEDRPAHEVLDYYGLRPALVPDRVPTFGEQGELTGGAAEALGLAPGTPVTYRAGDQPNNALALGALAPGEVAATAGTSGVVYGVSGRPAPDPHSRVNAFLHVNHAPDAPRYGVLLCLNGVGSLYRWLRGTLSVGGAVSYPEMNALADAAGGADGLTVLPFGNGAERVLDDRDLGAAVVGLDLNRHTPGHVVRAAQEGVAFAFRYGTEILAGTGVDVGRVRAPRANLFLSDGFAQAFATAVGATVDLVETDGAEGAARGAGVGAGAYGSPEEAVGAVRPARTVEPERGALDDAYARWRGALDARLGRPAQPEGQAA